MSGARTQKAAKKYFGKEAKQYDNKRCLKRMWIRESEVLREIMRYSARGPADDYEFKLLDCPVGTGRFLPMWEDFGFNVTGVDISNDMLAEAEKQRAQADTVLREGSIFDLPFPDKYFDVSVAIRIITLIEGPDMIRALRELQRVTRRDIIFNTRVPVLAEKTRKNAHRLETVRGCLLPEWRLVNDIEIHEPSFRMIRLCAG